MPGLLPRYVTATAKQPLLRGVVAGVWWGSMGLALGCSRETPSRSVPPLSSPAAAEAASSCRVLPEAAQAAEQFALPQYLFDFCLASVSPRFGVGGERPLAESCSRLWGSHCSVRSWEGAQATQAFRYASPSATAEVDVLVQTFQVVEQSQAWLDRVLETAVVGPPISAPGHAYLLNGDAVGYRDRSALRVMYSDRSDVAEQASAVAESATRRWMTELLRQLPGSEEAPEVLRRLPVEERLVGTERLVLREGLGVAGVKPAAFARYTNGRRFWQTMVVVRPDADSASDVLTSLKRHRRGGKLKWAPYEAFRFIEERGPQERASHWVIGRKQNVVYGVGDDPEALAVGVDPERVLLTTSQKLLELSRIARAAYLAP